LLNEFFAEGLALVSPSEALLRDGPAADDGGAGDNPPFVIEIGHDDLEPQVLFAQHIFHGDLRVFEDDVGGARDRGVARLDQLGDDSGSPFNYQHADSENALVAGSDGGDEVVGEGPVGNPFFGPVHDPELAALAFGGRAGQSRHVTAGVLITDGQADLLLAAQTLGHYHVRQRLGRKFYYARNADHEPCFQGVGHPWAPQTNHFLVCD